MRVYALTLLFLITGCAHWEGRSQMDLIQKFGLPTQQLATDQGTIFQYLECDNSSVTMPMPSYGNPNPIISSVELGGTCTKKMFLIKDQVVVKQLATIR